MRKTLNSLTQPQRRSKLNAKDIVVNLLKLNGQYLKYQTRLQREVYLLDRYGANFGLSFSYHDYCPYSSQLIDGWMEAENEKRIKIELESDGPHRIRCPTFKLTEEEEKAEEPEKLGQLDADVAKLQLKKMANASNIVLELAADIAYLVKEGYGGQAIGELKTRKPLKTQGTQLEEARKLLLALNATNESVNGVDDKPMALVEAAQ